MLLLSLALLRLLLLSLLITLSLLLLLIDEETELMLDEREEEEELVGWSCARHTHAAIARAARTVRASCGIVVAGARQTDSRAWETSGWRQEKRKEKPAQHSQQSRKTHTRTALLRGTGKRDSRQLAARWPELAAWGKEASLFDLTTRQLGLVVVIAAVVAACGGALLWFMQGSGRGRAAGRRARGTPCRSGSRCSA